jgi:disulfide bond formation protein DsbB
MAGERWREAGVPILVFIGGLATILGAWASQIVFGYQPCHLCLEERAPYYVGLPIVAIAIIAAFWGAPSRWVRLVMAVAGVVFAISVYLGVNHAGIEWGWWPGPPDCSPTDALAGIHSTQDLLNSLNGTRIVACNQASWRFLGLSFAGWNAVVSAILTVASAYAAAGGFSSEKITIVRKNPRVSTAP